MASPKRLELIELLCRGEKPVEAMASSGALLLWWGEKAHPRLNPAP